MPQFTVDEDLAALVEKLAKPKPFEHLTFSEALRRMLRNLGVPVKEGAIDLDKLFVESMELAGKGHKKAPSPSAEQWAQSVPELRSKKGLTTWKAICDHLKIKTGGDSARRRLKNWVKEHKTTWPEVPSVDGE